MFLCYCMSLKLGVLAGSKSLDPEIGSECGRALRSNFGSARSQDISQDLKKYHLASCMEGIAKNAAPSPTRLQSPRSVGRRHGWPSPLTQKAGTAWDPSFYGVPLPVGKGGPMGSRIPAYRSSMGAGRGHFCSYPCT